MDVRRIQAIKEGQDVVGSRTRVRVVKNKVAPPFREAEFDIMYNEGISKTGDLVDLGATMEIITKRGAFYTFNDSRIGQGRENAKRYLGEHPEMAAAIEKAIREQVQAEGGMPTGKPQADDESDDEE